MKRLIVMFVLFALPLSLFAQLHIGATALYLDDPQTVKDLPGYDANNILNKFAFGADARLQISLLEVSALAIYDFSGSVNMYLDGGIALDIAMFTVGAGVGVNYVFVITSANYDYAVAPFGFNGKIHADLNLGGIKISAYYMFMVDTFDFAAFQDNYRAGIIGASVLFKLF